jgi:hypothetical protein
VLVSTKECQLDFRSQKPKAKPLILTLQIKYYHNIGFNPIAPCGSQLNPKPLNVIFNFQNFKTILKDNICI